MKIVIEMTEDDYKKVKDGRAPVTMMRNTIRNGTPLPKGHGALKDADKLAVAIAMIRDKCNYYDNGYEHALFQAYDNCIDKIIDAPIIIESDEEVERNETIWC